MSLIEEARQKVAAACRLDGSQEPAALLVHRDVWARMGREMEAVTTHVRATSGGDTFMGLPVEFSDVPNHMAVRVTRAQQDSNLQHPA